MARISNIKVTNDKTNEVIAEMHRRLELALEGIGQEAEGYAKDDCPVDTGRLRNSITYATKTFQSSGNDRWDKGATQSATKKDMRKKGAPPADAVYIGTNVEYAETIEYGDKRHRTGKKHFLRDAAAGHADHYKAILKAALDK